MMITIIPEYYKTFDLLDLKKFEDASLSPTYVLHILLWKLEIQLISEAIYFRTEIKNGIFYFRKTILKI